MAIDEVKMVQSIYNTLFNVYTQTPPGGLPPGSQESNMFVVTILGGELIDVQQYANPHSPHNPQGVPAATENSLSLVDRLPFVKAEFVDSSKKVSDIYKAIVEGATIKPQPKDSVLRAAYDKACSRLQVHRV